MQKKKKKIYKVISDYKKKKAVANYPISKFVTDELSSHIINKYVEHATLQNMKNENIKKE